MQTKHLLSKEFVEFSGKIKVLHERREELVNDYQEYLKKFKADIASIDSEASDLQDNFDNWVTTQPDKKPVE